MLNRDRVAPVVAEFLGTGVWAFVALVLAETTSVSYFIATSVGLALVLVYLMFGGAWSGGFNPATTFGMWTAGRISTLRGLAYWVAQLLGGLASWQLYQYFVGHHIATKTSHWNWSVWVAELVGTAILTMAFAAAAYKKLEAVNAALTVGSALFVGVLVAATASAGYLNPAVALAERSFTWVYILGPLVGGLVGVNLYNWLFVGAKYNVRTIRKK